MCVGAAVGVEAAARSPLVQAPGEGRARQRGGVGALWLVALGLAWCGAACAQEEQGLGDNDKYAWIMAVGKGGVVLRSSNAGVTWREHTEYTGVTEDFNDVYFFDARRGYVVGENGLALVTNNAGFNWGSVAITPEDDPATPVAFYGIHLQRFPGPSFIVGADGLFSMSEDGEEWDNYKIMCVERLCKASVFAQAPEDGEGVHLGALRSVRFKDTSNGLIVGDNGVVLLTSDGGETFELVTVFAEGTPTPLPNLTHLDMDHLGFMVITGEQGIVIHVGHTSRADSDKIDFTFLGCNLVEGCNVPLPFSVGLGGAAGGGGITSNTLHTANLIDKLIITGGANGYLARYENGVWTELPRVGVGAESVVALYMSTPNTTVLVTDRGGIYRTSMGGFEWTPISIPEGYTFTSLSGRNVDDQSAAPRLGGAGNVLTALVVVLCAALSRFVAGV